MQRLIVPETARSSRFGGHDEMMDMYIRTQYEMVREATTRNLRTGRVKRELWYEEV